ncbi:hypothetical protein AVEN_194534-1 [Araneus ventricosus]|uniref:Secreted protein n=1 Tax=Araneus ventricosus TaxID=182803 RepID=A0A4Y2A6C1_ARAVE|nr:hypothetical protein AVEN_194534-1 [Araneus ventricosus]
MLLCCCCFLFHLIQSSTRKVQESARPQITIGERFMVKDESAASVGTRPWTPEEEVRLCPLPLRFIWPCLGIQASVNGSRRNSLSTETGVLVAITGHGPTPPKEIHNINPIIIVPPAEARTRLLIRRILIDKLGCPPGGSQFKNRNQKNWITPPCRSIRET